MNSSFEEEIQTCNSNIGIITEVIIQNVFYKWINKLLSEENKVPEHCLKIEGWQDPPHVNKVKQYKLCSLRSIYYHFYYCIYC